MSALEILCFGAIAVAALVYLVLERRRPYNPGQPLLREGFWTDIIFYAFVQSFVVGALIGRMIGWLDVHTGWSRYALLGRWPVWQQVAFFLITHDLYIYLFHRLQHRSPLLWRIHEAHHSVKHVDWIAAARSHALEIVINQTIEFAPMILLGAAPIVPVIKGTISAIWGMFIHCNVNVRLGRLQYVINGPEMHRWHHADNPDVYGKNFATKFAIWDWLFGTAYFPEMGRLRSQRYGIAEADYPEQFPQAYFLQHLRSIRRRPRVEDEHAAPAPDARVGVAG